MTIFQALLLGIIQGITEFLPVSSSGHLILGEYFLRLSHDSLQSFDIAVHFGTLLAVILYFWKDYMAMAKAFIHWILAKGKIQNKHDQEEVRLFGWLIIGTLPAIIVGYFWGDKIDDIFRDPRMVAGALIIVSFYFIWAEMRAKKLAMEKKIHAGTDSLSFGKVASIGLAQAMALFHGVSRSGATISTGLALGMERKEAARFSFLLGSIAILAASTLTFYKVLKHEMVLPSTDVLLTGVVSSFIAGYASIAFLMKFLRSRKLYVFAVYRILLGVIILIFLR